MALFRRGNIWWINFTAPDGNRIRQTAGTSDRKKAQELFDKLKHESWRVQKLGEAPRHTWDEAALLWLKEKADKKSLQDDVGMLRYLTPIFRGKYLDEITRTMIAQVAEAKKAESTPARANRYLALIRAIFNRAVRIWGWLDKAPTISLYREPKRRVRYLTSAEIRRICEELPAHLKPIFMFSILTGLRKSNVLNLRWDQVNFQANLIFFSGCEMKAGKDHAVPITEAIRNILIAQKGKHLSYVFTYKGSPIKDVKTAFRKALQRAAILDYRWHDNRHTWASALIQHGVPLNEVQEMGGWNSAEMVKRYAHLAPQKLAHNASIVDDVFSDAVTILSQLQNEEKRSA